VKAGKLNLITLGVNARERATDFGLSYALSVESQSVSW
jgi:hypothetical protein